MEVAKTLYEEGKKKWHNMSHLERFGLEVAVAGVAFVAYSEWKKHHGNKSHSEETSRAAFIAYQKTAIEKQNAHHDNLAPKSIQRQVVEFSALPDRITRPEAVKGAIHKRNDVEHFKSVLGTFLKCVSERQVARMKYQHSQDAVSLYNYLMNELEHANFAVLGNNHNKSGFLHSSEIDVEGYLEVLRLFRLELFLSLIHKSKLVAFFASTLVRTPTDRHPLSTDTIELYGDYWSQNAVAKEANGGKIDAFSGARTLFLIDDSASMNQVTAGDGPTAFSITRSICAEIVPLITTHAACGVDFLFLNSTSICVGVQDSDWVLGIFDHTFSDGGTHAGRRIQEVLDSYFSVLRYDSKIQPLNLIIFTDGVVNDELLLRKALENHANKRRKFFSRCQIGIQFVHVGGCDGGLDSLLSLQGLVNQREHVVGVTSARNEGAAKQILHSIEHDICKPLRQKRGETSLLPSQANYPNQ